MKKRWSKEELDEIAGVGEKQLLDGQQIGEVKSYFVEGNSRKVRVNWTAFNRYYEQFKAAWGRSMVDKKKPSLLRRILDAIVP